MQAIDLPASWMRRALLAFGSESASEDRAREEVQRAADPSSQPSASGVRRGHMQWMANPALAKAARDRDEGWLSRSTMQ